MKTSAEQTALFAAEAHNREAWLAEVTRRVAPWFDDLGKPVPAKIRVTCGWPSSRGAGGRSRVIGQCFNPSCSADGHTELFISPTLAELTEVTATLVHELVHAAVGTEHAHKAPFAKAARALDLEGKPTHTFGGDKFRARIAPILAAVGPYPHAKLDISSALKKQTTRLLKATCADCGYTVRTTAKWLSAVGAPLCPCNHEEMRVG